MLVSPTGCIAKKLTAIATEWRSGPQTDLNDEIEGWGGDATEWAIEPVDTLVHPGNWKALKAFLVIDHCWHYNVDEQRRRINWSDARFIWEQMDVSVSQADFEKICLIENLVREV